MRPLLPIAGLALMMVSLACRERRTATENPQISSNLDKSPASKNGEIIIDDGEQVTITYRPPSPEYPSELKRRQVEGEVRLVIHLTKDGQITKIEQELGPIEFLPFAEAYARSCRFKVNPTALYDRETIPFRMTIKYRLRSLHRGTENTK